MKTKEEISLMRDSLYDELKLSEISLFNTSSGEELTKIDLTPSFEQKRVIWAKINILNWVLEETI